MPNKETPVERRKRELQHKYNLPKSAKLFMVEEQITTDYTINEAITHADESECWG